MTVRKNDRAVMSMVAEVAGRPLREVHAVDVEHGFVIITTAFTMRITAEERARIKRELSSRLGRSVSLV